MIKKPFFGIGKPRIAYDCLGAPPSEARKMAVPESVVLLCKGRLNRTDAFSLAVGAEVRVGQKIVPFKDDDAYVISPLSGVVSVIRPYTGNFGETFAAVHIRSDGKQTRDESFAQQAGTPALDSARAFLGRLPGDPSAVLFPSPEKPLKTIVIQGMDSDPGVSTQQFVVKTRIDNLIQGASALKSMHPSVELVLTVPEPLKSDVQKTGIPIHIVANRYPEALPHLIARNLLNRTIPAGRSPGDLGIAFIRAEAVASLGKAFADKRIPVEKVVTVISKKGVCTLVEASIGAPVSVLLDAAGESVHGGDRLIAGGPMTGNALYDLGHPVTPDLDAIAVQGSSDLFMVSDSYCINCGECIRVCPARIQVNMLVRYLEAKKYQDAMEEYDLDACVECGLCGFVCPSRMPIFQYIRLAKYEIVRVREAMEANNG